MTCDGCAKDISGALHRLPGITKVEANVQDQLVSVEGTGPYPGSDHDSDGLLSRLLTYPVPRFWCQDGLLTSQTYLAAAPSAIVEAIQATGRDAILRGSGTSNSKSTNIPRSLGLQH